MDTIFALASARGRAGVSVVRISGPGADGALAALCGALPVVRVATLRTVQIGGEAVDRALVVRFAQGASFTGEAVELRPDLDQIAALAVERDQQWARVGAADFLTPAEKRVILGLPRLAEDE